MTRQLKIAALGLAAFMAAAGPAYAQISAEDAPFCIEMTNHGLDFSVVVEIEDDGIVKKSGYEEGSCAELGDRIRVEWTDYQGIFSVTWKSYYPKKIREPDDLTWFVMGTVDHYEPSDLKKAFEKLVSGERVQLKMGYDYRSKAYQCYRDGEPCVWELEEDSNEIGLLDYRISEKSRLEIDGQSYEVWIIEWSSGKIIYSPLLRIPLKEYAYRSFQKQPELYLVTEVTGIHRLKKAPASDRK